MNLTTLELRVQRTVGLAAGTAGDEQTLLRGWATEAALKFLQRTKAVKRTASLQLTAGTADYTLDADIIAFEDIYIDPADGSDELMLVPVDSYDLRQMRRAASSVASPPSHYYAYEGNILMLYPTPASSSDTLHIVYVEKPSGTFSTGSDSWSDATRGRIPEQYHDVLQAYVMWKAAEYSNDAPSGNGQSFMQQWEKGIMETKITEAKRAGVRTPRARVGRRRSRFAPSPGQDVRY